MVDYAEVLHNRMVTYLMTVSPKPVVIGMVEQFRPGKFKWHRYLKPVGLEKTLTLSLMKAAKEGPHILQKRSHAIWALKNNYENSLKEPA
ncbi:hypothetical protein [Mesorhizobium sp. M0767]|uniref:hypothetical protein n=1 Tax=Mesorhizobium sp. M0767 TaxID=2956995 RepID=UPI00333BF2DA